MKPIILEMEDLSDSMEIYHSKPCSYVSGFIYIILAMMIAFSIWMHSTKMDIVVREKGTFHGNIDEMELHVNNSDIAKLKSGQKVRFEITSYPASEYGYFTGFIKSIPDKAKYDDHGKAYYEIKVACDMENMTDRNGNKIRIMDGMECKAKIVVGTKNVMGYLMENMMK